MRRLLPLLALLVIACAVPASAHASSKQVVTFEAPTELTNPATIPATLDEIKAFGVYRIRQLVYWDKIAPDPDSATRPSFNATDPNAYPAANWATLDYLMQAAKDRGMSVMLTITGPAPKWATASKKDNLTNPSASEFGQFAQAVGARYGDQVSLWSIWNEPNQPQFLLPQFKNGKAASPAIYRKLYQAAYKGIRATASNAKDDILLGETSPRGNAHIVAPLAFLRGTLCLSSTYVRSKSCGELQTDGYAQHAYTTAAGPSFVPPGKDDVTIGVIPRLVTALDKAAAAGAIPAQTPIYLTEFGIQSYPDKVSGVSQALQAAYMAVSEHIAYANPRVVAFSQYLMRDDQPCAKPQYKYCGFESGLRTSNGTKKPAYDAFRLPLAVQQYGSEDVLWGLVRPDRAKTSVTIQRRSKGSKTWTTVKKLSTTAAGVYSLTLARRAGASYRVRWTDAGGTTFSGPPIQEYVPRTA